MTKKRQQGPRPITITPATAASQYQRKWTNRELVEMLNGLVPYAPLMPNELWDRVRQLIVGQMALTIEEVHYIRGRVRDEAIEEVGWDASIDEAVKRLSFSVGEHTMERSHRLYRKSLPPGQQKRRKRRLPVA